MPHTTMHRLITKGISMKPMKTFIYKMTIKIFKLFVSKVRDCTIYSL